MDGSTIAAGLTVIFSGGIIIAGAAFVRGQVDEAIRGLKAASARQNGADREAARKLDGKVDKADCARYTAVISKTQEQMARQIADIHRKLMGS